MDSTSQKNTVKNDGDPVRSRNHGFVRSFFTKLGLDASTLTAMLKGSLPPTIGIAMCHAPAVASYFGTISYLVPITSVLAMSVLPRGKFLMNLILNLLAVCFGTALSMLALWSAVQARHHTTPDGIPPGLAPKYNASQSAVCAIWLFASIWFGNVVRAKLPAFNLPIITYSILVNIAVTFGSSLSTTTAVEMFVTQLFTSMLTALAIALGVNLLVFPVSSRLVVVKEFAAGFGLLKKLVSQQKAYLASPESTARYSTLTRPETLFGKVEDDGTPEDQQPKVVRENKAEDALQETGTKIRELVGKLHVDVPFAKREIAWGRLDAKDLAEIFKLFRNLYIPILGMNTIIDIFRRFSERPDWTIDGDAPAEIIAEKLKEQHVWDEVMKQVQEPFEILSEAIDKGLEHAGICLGILPRLKRQPVRRFSQPNQNPFETDLEGAEELQPGDLHFARVIDEKIYAFRSRKGELLRTWVRQRGVNLDDDGGGPSSFRSERDQVQFYIILYLENLMHASGEAVQDLVDFADEKIADGTMSKKRFIVPSTRRLRKWLRGIFNNEDSSGEESPDIMESSRNVVYFGDAYKRRKDPEHLPPETAWQHFGNHLRKISKFLGSEESSFGFRVACATMSVGILAFLEHTQHFFFEQRLVWAMIAIAIGMSMTSGQSLFGFLCRIGGTIFAMICSLIVWYIVNEHVAGIIFFLWVVLCINYYLFVKYPRIVPAIIISVVTQCMIIGYELQVIAIGREAAEKSGQPFYPTYLLAPYRVACVAGGTFVAFLWTIFPSPLTDRTWLRRDLSATLYLLANYFGVIHSTLKSNVQGTIGDINVHGTPAHHLYKVTRKIFGKLMMLIPSMSQHSEYQKWEPTIGGKFPRDAYNDIIKRSNRILSYLILTSYTLMHPTRLRVRDRLMDDFSGAERQGRFPGGFRSRPQTLSSRCPSVSSANHEWLTALAEVLEILKPTHHTILSTLTLLSNSLLSGQSLPPFLPLPKPYEMTRQLMKLSKSSADVALYDPDGVPVRMVSSRTGREDEYHLDLHRDAALANILGPRNIEKPGYAEFAVLQVCTTLVCDDLEGLMEDVSRLVGVVDFDFHFGVSESSLNLEHSLRRGKRK